MDTTTTTEQAPSVTTTDETKAAAQVAATTTPETKAAPEQAPQAKKTPEINILKHLGYAIQEQEKPEEIDLGNEEKPVEAPAAEAPAEEGEQPATDPAKVEGDKETPRVRKKAKISALDQLPATAPTVQPEAAPKAEDKVASVVDAAVAKAKTATETPDDNLPPEDKKAVELADYAAKVDPRYADVGRRQREFLKARNQHISDWLKENEARPDSPEFHEYLNSAEYRQFIRSSQPQFDRETVKEKMIEDRVAEKARKEAERLQAEFDLKLKRLEVLPVIRQAADEVEKGVLDIEDDVVAQFRENPQEALAQHPNTAPIVADLSQSAKTLVNEYLEITQGLKEVDARNPVHVNLDRFIEERGQQLDAIPEAQRVRNGKVVVSPSKYRQMAAARDPNLARFETFSPRDIVNLIQETHRGAISVRLKAYRDAVEKEGYVKNKPSGQAAPATTSAKQPAKEVEPSPKSVSSRAAGPSGKPAGKTFTAAEKALGYATINR